MILEARDARGAGRGAGDRQRDERAGRARPAARAAAGGRRGAPPVRRRALGVQRHGAALELARAAAPWRAERTRRASAAPVEPRLSHRKQEQLLRENFISPRRVREWRDIHSQLHTVVAEHGWRLNRVAGHLRAAAPVAAGRPARQHRLQERRRRVVPRRARHPLPPSSRRQPVEEAGPLDRRRRTGRDDAAVRPQPGRHRSALAAADRRPPDQDPAARAALGEEGGRGGRARTRDAATAS